jgi:hypothetical protein
MLPPLPLPSPLEKHPKDGRTIITNAMIIITIVPSSVLRPVDAAMIDIATHHHHPTLHTRGRRTKKIPARHNNRELMTPRAPNPMAARANRRITPADTSRKLDIADTVIDASTRTPNRTLRRSNAISQKAYASSSLRELARKVKIAITSILATLTPLCPRNDRLVIPVEQKSNPVLILTRRMTAHPTKTRSRRPRRKATLEQRMRTLPLLRCSMKWKQSKLPPPNPTNADARNAT